MPVAPLGGDGHRRRAVAKRVRDEVADDPVECMHVREHLELGRDLDRHLGRTIAGKRVEELLDAGAHGELLRREISPRSHSSRFGGGRNAVVKR
jgi:hypothetical protein